MTHCELRKQPQLPLMSGWAQRLHALVNDGVGSRPAFRFVAGADATETASMDFETWWRVGREVAAGLTAAGLAPGGRVAVMSAGGPSWPILQIASSLLGAMVVPVNSRYRLDELRHLVRLTRPDVVVLGERFFDRGMLQALEQERCAATVFADASAMAPLARGMRPWEELLRPAGHHDAPPHDGTGPGLVQLTSGTTAFAKGALLTERATLNVAYYMGERIGLHADDVVFSTQPFYHVGGSVTTTLMPLAHGCCMVVPDHYTPEGTLRALGKFRCTARYGQAAMYAMELAHETFVPDGHPHLTKGWGLGPRPLLERVGALMGVTRLVQLYGLTEGSGVSTVAHHESDADTRLATCGPAFPGIELRIDAEHGPGELCLRGWSLMQGYVQEDGSVDPAVDENGWFHTGDVGVLDDHGNFCFTDRLKDMIKPGGENVASAEVERVLLTHPDVAEVAVVGRPDPRLGEVPVAFVRWSTNGGSADALLAHAAEQIASFKVPRAVITVEAFPMTASGKIVKAKLRERFSAEAHSQFVGQSG